MADSPNPRYTQFADGWKRRSWAHPNQAQVVAPPPVPRRVGRCGGQLAQQPLISLRDEARTMRTELTSGSSLPFDKAQYPTWKAVPDAENLEQLPGYLRARGCASQPRTDL